MFGETLRQKQGGRRMSYLLIGLFLFLGVHSVRIFADSWRTQTIRKYGELVYKGVYALLSLVGFCLIVWGFGVARETPMVLWQPPMVMRHVASLLMLVAFVLLAATYVPNNAIKARLHHPMVLGVKTWAIAHLLTTGTVAHIALFGSFLVWGVWLFVVSRRRDRLTHVQYPTATPGGTIATAVVGVAAWALFAFALHGILIGIRPFG
jgi:uncharacterized membrane protein